MPSPNVTSTAFAGCKRDCAFGRFAHIVTAVDLERPTFCIRPWPDFARDGFCSCAADEAVQNSGDIKNA